MKLPSPQLILQTFACRQDIYALRWNSGGKTGYSPACNNFWVEGVCKKRDKSGSCRNCPDKSYIPLSEIPIAKHLKGEDSLGVYPLLSDNTTWWLALDFDDHSSEATGKDPFQDAEQYRQACQERGITCYLERSRSGNGVHAWIFFSQPTPSWLARRAGMALALEAQVVTKGADQKTFDRFFPNQDEHTGQAYGNLIALPFARKATEKGNSVFYDPDTQQAFEDQEAFLKQIQRVPIAKLHDMESTARNFGLTWGPGRMFEGSANTPAEQEKSFDRPGLQRVLSCDFFKHCEDHAEDLSEPLWYGMITNLVAFKDGEAKIHELSALDESRYSHEATHLKIDQAKDAVRQYGPHTCEYLKTNGFNCTRFGVCSIEAPAGLAAAKSTIQIRNGCYYRVKDGTTKRISNFVMTLLHTYLTPDGAKREVVLKNELGQTSDPQTLEPGPMASHHKFREFAMRAGNFSFTGNINDLDEICRNLFNDAKDFIYQPDHIGCIDHSKLWLFGNGAIFGDKAELIWPDDSGIIWAGGKGYRPLPLEDGDILPMLEVTTDDWTAEQLTELLETFRIAFGTYYAWLMLGWCISGFFSDEIFDKYKCYPLAFVAGKRRSGKSTFASMLLRVFGFEIDPSGAKSFENSSVVAVARELAHRASVPVWFDEYRNTQKTANKDGLLRSVYNRSGIGKGHLGFGVNTTKVRAITLLSGEHTPKDNAVLTRCVVTQLNETTRDDNAFERLSKMMDRFPAVGRAVLEQKLSVGSEAVLQQIEEIKTGLMKAGLDSRQAVNYGICAGGFTACFGQILETGEFVKWLAAEAMRDKQEKDEEHPTHQFLEDVMFMLDSQELAAGTDFVKTETKLFLSMARVYPMWERFCRSRGRAELVKKNDLLKDLRSEPFVEDELVPKRFPGFDNRPVKCLVVDLERAPEELRR